MGTFCVRTYITTALSAAILVLPLSALAMTVVECVDKSGAAVFMEKCPPGMSQKGEKRLRGHRVATGDEPPSAEDIAKDHPVTLFAVEQCEACDLVRTKLKARTIPFTEIDVSKSQENFAKLTEVTGGAATVPVLTVDEKVLTGFNSASLDAALNDAGYPQ